MSDRLEAAREIAAKWRELSKQIVIDIPAQAAIILDDRITELEKCREDIADWKGLISIEQDAGMGWKDKAEKAEAEAENAKGASSAKGACMKAALNQLSIARAEIKRLKAILAYQGKVF